MDFHRCQRKASGPKSPWRNLVDRRNLETAMAAPTLLFIALLWWAVGRWIDRHWTASTRTVWGSLLGFTLICAAGTSVPSTTFYLAWGVLVWIVVGCRMAFGMRDRVRAGF